MSASLASESSATASCDVVIAGGGMVGATLALALAQRLPDWTIALVDQFAPPAKNTVAVAQRFVSSSFDGRSTVLSEGSRRILEALQLWSPLQTAATPITDIHVSERRQFATVQLTAQQRGWDALGYVIENSQLGKTLFAAIRACPAIRFYGGSAVVATHPESDAYSVEVQQQDRHLVLRGKLLVIADGANSALCRALGIGVRQHDYAQAALIANVGFSKPHNGFAYERFTDWGPMALLPLAEQQGVQRAALIWTMDQQRAGQLQQLADAEFLALLQQRFGYRQGRFLRVGERHSYPLHLYSAAEQVRQRLVVLGNAAHALHPVAGQGFNLSLRDVMALVDSLAEAVAAQQSPFALPVLRGYLQQRDSDQRATTAFSHYLTELFASDNPLLRHGRRLGLLALDGLPPLKNRFTDFAAGVNS